MLASSASRLARDLSADAVVLDVGGWADPLRRADWVIDLLPHETRDPYPPTFRAAVGAQLDESTPERFTSATWVQRDICDREPWPFADGQFDYAVCSHTLEDVRDPVWVCRELQRVARAGYIEVPSRLEEQSFGVHGPWVGWSHHHWLCDVGSDGIEFVFKSHVMHARSSDHFPAGFRDSLTAEQRVQQLWWDGSFTATERIFVEAEGLDAYLQDFITAHRPDGPAPAVQQGRRTWRRPRGGRDRA